jgi:hypothetical protein
MKTVFKRLTATGSIGLALLLIGGTAAGGPAGSATGTVKAIASGTSSSPVTVTTGSAGSSATGTVYSGPAGTVHGTPTASPPARHHAGVVTRPVVTADTLSPAAEELANTIKFDRQVLLIVKAETHERIQRLVGYDDDGYQLVAPGIAVTVPEDRSLEILRELRRKLHPLHYLAFIVESNSGLKTDKIGVIKGPDPYEIIRIMNTGGDENGISTDDVLERLKDWEKISSFHILGADSSRVELEFTRLPADLKAFAEEVYDFSPDAVDEGPGTVEALMKELRKTGRIILMWE